MLRVGPGSLVLAAWSLAAASAHAHGGPVSVEVVAYHAAAPERMAVGTGYGLATTFDGGASWALTCEGAIGTTGSAHPRIAVTSTGALVAGLFTGSVRSDPSGCNFAPVNDLAGYVTLDVQNVPGDPRGLVALTRQGQSFQLWRSTDDGVSFSLLNADLDPKFAARSVGATSDPDRLYVGGLTSSDGVAALLITDDGGQTFTSVIVPDVATAPNDALFVEAVHPADPNTLVLALYEPPSRVLLSTDGGASYGELFVGTTVLTGLAVARDFTSIVAGSPTLGLWRVPFGGSPVQVSDVPVRCLTWTDDALLVCADEAVTGYAVGRSTDGGETIAPLLELRCLEQPDCDATSQVEHACVSEWPQLVNDLGLEACGASGGGAGVGASDASGGGASHEGGRGGAGGAGGPLRYRSVGGCATHPERDASHERRLLGALLAAASLVIGHRRGGSVERAPQPRSASHS